MPALPELQAALPTGELRVRVAQCLSPPEELFTFAVRRNPKRAFLFLSKVLGKHLPVGPRRMADTHRRLAALVPPDLPEPLLFIGMAETATALGQGLFEAWLSQNPQARALFLHSTRYQVRGAEAAGFGTSRTAKMERERRLPRPLFAAGFCLFGIVSMIRSRSVSCRRSESRLRRSSC